MELTLASFLERNRIEQTDWDRSECDWESLKLIADDHNANRQNLEQAVEMHAGIIQQIGAVHSVRWRIKDSEHVLEKIVRKKLEGEEKYKSIDVDNYKSIITDLIGLRALHLFKEDCFSIHESLIATFEMPETPKAYIRSGDADGISKRYKSCGMEIATHPAGYRSIHYIISSKPLKEVIKAEIQVRTLFEEGWSEIDHRIRYPNYSDNELIMYFLQIFNRLAGSADEMGSFVSELERSLSENEKRLASHNEERQSSFNRIDELVKQLQAATNQVAAVGEERDSVRNTLERLQDEMAILKQETASPEGIDGAITYHKFLTSIGIQIPHPLTVTRQKRSIKNNLPINTTPPKE
ncbi:RelA/SpoT domain-containing protein [Stenotrophomonas maltophilia]|uniref:RelA/SpoT domain-containing protein n=1 Tax=Stenotrophomonas maltophilia TaxID=40324 RepID=UPI0012B13E06|nr:RelA/SpoT domain-containing protein [Stenotrophomonas maltophilia]ELC7363681.1 hypothetical protein [Stenotrophomonas maltophilia]MBA0252662.1 hypothetical protein [Stenotrophomonas maltophilia]MBA0320247.1 hypothetical protein [Stenotrophomonas maltophilia]MBH1632007.1 hypothetical protein [Stenotrophomonas maltophilia]MCU1144205.1 hypothetical protein [Stenotrophomonas maltophilia]